MKKGAILLFYAVTAVFFGPFSGAAHAHSARHDFEIEQWVRDVMEDDVTIEDIQLGATGKILGTTATIDFTNFDVSGTGQVDLAGGINLSGGTAGAANTIDFGGGADDDLSATDVTELTDGAVIAAGYHTHAAAGPTLDNAYNAGTGERTVTVDAGDISFDLNDATNDYKIVIDNTTNATLDDALVIATTGASDTFTDGIDVSDAGIVNAINIGANTIVGNGTMTFDLNSTMAATTLSIVNTGAPAGGTAVTVDVVGTINLNMTGTATAGAVCHTGVDIDTTGTDRDLVICTEAPDDLAAWYETAEDVDAADIVATSERTIQYTSTVTRQETGAVLSGPRRQSSVLIRSSRPYSGSIVGVISTASWRTMGKDIATGAKHPMEVALMGRVPVKVSAENGPIQAGDRITSSSTPGVGMRATKAGHIVGIALSSYEGTAIGKIMLFVTKHSYLPSGLERASDAFVNLDPKSLRLLRTMIALYEGSPEKKALHEISEVPPEMLRKLASISERLIREDRKQPFKRSLQALSDEKLSKLLGAVFFVDEDLLVKGEIIKTMSPQKEAAYAKMATTPRLFDRGEARLREGRGTVELNREFLSAVYIDETHPLFVRITPASLDIAGPIVVIERTDRSFTVQELDGGRSEALFMWEASAIRKAPEFLKLEAKR